MSGILLVTGGGRGIGAATALLAAERGYDVCVNYQGNAAAAERVAEQVRARGRRALAVQADVASEAEVEALFETVDRELGTLTALFANAGITGRIGRVDEVSGETLRRVTEVNVLGLMYCNRAAVRRLSTRHGGQGGAIVNVSSGAATLGSPNTFVWYAASKAAVDSFTKGLALETAREGIRVNAVAPGLIDTEIHASSGAPDRARTMAEQIPMGRPAGPETVAEAALWLLSDAASYVTGEVLRVAGGR